MDFITIFDNTLNQTLIYAFLALSVYISLRLLDFPDLSIEGIFPMGAAIAVAITKYSELAGLSIPIAMFFGFIIGAITASLYIYLKIGKLLSGILVSIGLYSINFRIMGAKGNLYLNENENIITPLRTLDTTISNYIFHDTPVVLYPFSNFILIILFALVVFLLYKLLITEKGFLIKNGRADNKYFYESIGVNYKIYVIIGLGIASSLAALSGALAAFQSGSSSLTMGFGIILVALVSLVIGEQIIKIFHKDLTDLFPTILAPFIGTFVYYLIIRIISWLNTLWQSFTGYPDPTDQFQFFNSDIRILSAIIMIIIYVFRKDKITSLNLPERL